MNYFYLLRDAYFLLLLGGTNISKMSAAAKMREYPEKGCDCPIHASHGGCVSALRYKQYVCEDCHATDITQEARDRQYMPPKDDYFTRTFGRAVEEAKKYNRRAFK